LWLLVGVAVVPMALAVAVVLVHYKQAQNLLTQLFHIRLL